MPLIQKKVVTTTIVELPSPDSSGWFWMLQGGTIWEPVEVFPGLKGYAASYRVDDTLIPVHDLPEGWLWGDMIKRCSQEMQRTLGGESELEVKQRLSKNYPQYKPDLTEQTPTREPLRVDGGEPHMIVDAEVLEEVLDQLVTDDLSHLDEEWERRPTRLAKLYSGDPVEWEVGGTVIDTNNPHDWPDMRKEAHARQRFYCPREKSQCRGPEKPIFNDKLRLLSWYSHDCAN